MELATRPHLRLLQPSLLQRLQHDLQQTSLSTCSGGTTSPRASFELIQSSLFPDQNRHWLCRCYAHLFPFHTVFMHNVSVRQQIWINLCNVKTRRLFFLLNKLMVKIELLLTKEMVIFTRYVHAIIGSSNEKNPERKLEP